MLSMLYDPRDDWLWRIDGTASRMSHTSPSWLYRSDVNKSVVFSHVILIVSIKYKKHVLHLITSPQLLLVSSVMFLKGFLPTLASTPASLLIMAATNFSSLFFFNNIGY